MPQDRTRRQAQETGAADAPHHNARRAARNEFGPRGLITFAPRELDTESVFARSLARHKLLLVSGGNTKWDASYAGAHPANVTHRWAAVPASRFTTSSNAATPTRLSKTELYRHGVSGGLLVHRSEPKTTGHHLETPRQGRGRDLGHHGAV